MTSIMQELSNEYTEKNSGNKSYVNHVKKFIDYIKLVGKEDRPTNISLKDVGECVGYYNELQKINSQNSMELHIEAIKSFYDYCSESGKQNDIFIQYNERQFKDELTLTYNLAEPKKRDFFEVEIIKEILEKLDLYLEQGCKNKKIRTITNYHNRISLRLFIKLMLVAPTKKSTICEVKLSDFSKDFRILTINGVDVNIPNSLKRDICHAISLKGKTGDINSSMKLFEFVYGDNFKNEYVNAWFCSFLREFEIVDIPDSKTSYEIESIMKTAISGMVNNLANPAVISAISGISIASLENTYYGDEFRTLRVETTVDETINFEVSKSKYYNYI